MADGPGYHSTQTHAASASDFNVLSFLVESMLSRISTVTMCKVVKVKNSGGLAPVGFVDLELLVKLLDGAGNSTKRPVVYRCPYLRVQGGANAIIIDPQVGDTGLVAFCDRDISSATANMEAGNTAQANPGSARRFDIADAVYLFGWMPSVTPTQYVQFNADGIRIHSPTLVKIDAPDIQITASTVEITAPIVTITASTSTTVTTPTFTVNGALVTTGNISGGANVTAASQVADSVGNLAAMRTAHNLHRGHGSPGTGNVPDHLM